MVEGGYVTLSGTVDWEYQRRAAAGSVRGLMGVTGVSDQIAIQCKNPGCRGQVRDRDRGRTAA
ncbi:BON domain-containing protein [Rugamonas sp.]|uniref:BON domain-containing protein n=1 Tax=Rugamonas sp. TaxID=1926287 RepID=UPI00345BA872